MIVVYCQIENGVVVNRAVFDENMPNGWGADDLWLAENIAQIGWLYDGVVFTSPYQGGVVEDYFEPVAPIDEPVALEE